MSAFNVTKSRDAYSSGDQNYYNVGNYCTDEAIMKQHALHMKLNNLLWRYSMTHNGEKIDWRNKEQDKYTICYNCAFNEYRTIHIWDCNYNCKYIGIYFINKEVAEAAIEEVVKPFINENPDFDWKGM